MQSLKWLAVVLLLGISLTACSSALQSTTETGPASTQRMPATTKPTEPQPADPESRPTEAGSANPADGLTRQDAQEAVTVEVTPRNLGDSGDTLDFEIAMDTHSVDLGMDLTALATLSTNTGWSVQPLTWNGGRGGHHVSGTLSFPAQVDGAALLEGATALTLVLREVDAPERVFSWEITP